MEFSINKNKKINRVKYSIKKFHLLRSKENTVEKPNWIKIKFPSNLNRYSSIKSMMRKNKVYSVCEEAACPNIFECFNRGTATFMILGRICTRKCSFCNVVHGKPFLPDINEPERLAKIISDMNLQYIVITSVNRDDLIDGGARHFVKCIKSIRLQNPSIKVEILVPDFRNKIDHALSIINTCPPDIFNHNLENVPRLYRLVRPGSNYYHSLSLLEKFKVHNPSIPTKSGLMVGLGEKISEIIEVMHDLYAHGVTMLTIGQYLQPTRYHIPVHRYVTQNEFDEIKDKAISIGFSYVACGPLVRSSYHADLQSKGIEIKSDRF